MHSWQTMLIVKQSAAWVVVRSLVLRTSHVMYNVTPKHINSIVPYCMILLETVDIRNDVCLCEVWFCPCLISRTSSVQYLRRSWPMPAMDRILSLYHTTVLSSPTTRALDKPCFFQASKRQFSPPKAELYACTMAQTCGSASVGPICQWWMFVELGVGWAFRL